MHGSLLNVSKASKRSLISINNNDIKNLLELSIYNLTLLNRMCAEVG